MKYGLWICQFALVTGVYAKPAPSATALFDQIISHPGSYYQVCDVNEVAPEIPYQAFHLTDSAGAAFSKTNLASMKLNRLSLIKSARARLAAVDFAIEGKQPSADAKPEENEDGDAYGCDPTTLNPLTLKLLQEIQAVETLPELLVLEEKLVAQIAKAKDDEQAASPKVYGWIVGGSRAEEGWSEAKRDRFNQLFQARVAQRDLVILIADLLRQQRYPAYLKTSFEATYVKGLTAAAKAADLLDLQEGAIIPAKIDGQDIEVDPITKLFRFTRRAISIPYSRETRDEIRAAAAQWIAEHP
jgi:hypothetical protein